MSVSDRERKHMAKMGLYQDMRGACTTVVVGPDGRIFDLCKEPFPIREATKDQAAYFPVNAYTVAVHMPGWDPELGDYRSYN